MTDIHITPEPFLPGSGADPDEGRRAARAQAHAALVAALERAGCSTAVAELNVSTLTKAYLKTGSVKLLLTFDQLDSGAAMTFEHLHSEAVRLMTAEVLREIEDGETVPLLTSSQRRMLAWIAEHDGCIFPDIQAEVDADRQFRIVSQTLASLVKSKLVDERRPTLSDFPTYHISDYGRTVLNGQGAAVAALRAQRDKIEEHGSRPPDVVHCKMHGHLWEPPLPLVGPGDNKGPFDTTCAVCDTTLHIDKSGARSYVYPESYSYKGDETP